MNDDDEFELRRLLLATVRHSSREQTQCAGKFQHLTREAAVYSMRHMKYGKPAVYKCDC